ncbi:hypothetical protein DXT90_02020 [Agrobacterium tumefaciens]|nr:hypothetical protein [Agrobacterium tumefaciens]
MDKKLVCLFVGHREKTEKSRCSPAPSRPFDTARLLPIERAPQALVPEKLTAQRPEQVGKKTKRDARGWRSGFDTRARRLAK